MKYIIGFLIGIIILMFGWFSIIESPRTNRNVKLLYGKYDSISNAYDSLVLSKQKIDTIRDTIYIEKKIEIPKPYKTVDTIYLDKPYEANWYFDSIVSEDIVINYNILTFGLLRDFHLEYKLFKTTITKENIVYVDRPVIQEVWYPKRHLYLGASLGTDINYYSFDAIYLTKKQLGFKAGYVNWLGNHVWTGGVLIKIF